MKCEKCEDRLVSTTKLSRRGYSTYTHKYTIKPQKLFTMEDNTKLSARDLTEIDRDCKSSPKKLRANLPLHFTNQTQQQKPSGDQKVAFQYKNSSKMTK